jgi:hypothetical protein
MFPIRNGLKQEVLYRHCFSTLLLSMPLGCSGKPDGLKLKGMHHILGGSVHTVKENAEALLVASKEIGLEVNADKTKYMVMSRDQNVGRSHDMNNLWKGGRAEIFGNNLNKSKFYSGRYTLRTAIFSSISQIINSK